MRGAPTTSDGARSLRLMLGASALTTLGAIPPFLLGAQAVWVRSDLAVGLAALGVAVSAFFCAAALTTPVASAVLDRAGRRAGLLLAGTLVAAGGAGVGLVARDALTLILCMVILGMGNACCQAAANLSMARALPAGRRGLGFGVKQSAVPLAIMLGGLAVPTMGGLLGWRSTFLTTATIGVVVALAALGSRDRSAHAVRTSAADTDDPPWRPLLLCGLAITFASAAANSLGAFIASWGDEVGLTATASGLLMAAGSAGSILTRVWSGYRADGRHGGNLPVVAVQMLAGAGCLLGVATGLPVAVLVFGFLGFAVGWSWPGLLLFAVARLGRDAPARASGVVQAGAFAGGALGPACFGALAATWGFTPTWAGAAGCFLVAGVLILVARRLFAADLERRPPRTPLTWGGGRADRAPRREAGRG